MGHSLEELHLENYEVVHCDPLHDFKSIIHHIHEVLPYQVGNQDLKEFCKTCIEEGKT